MHALCTIMAIIIFLYSRLADGCMYDPKKVAAYELDVQFTYFTPSSVRRVQASTETTDVQESPRIDAMYNTQTMNIKARFDDNL